MNQECLFHGKSKVTLLNIYAVSPDQAPMHLLLEADPCERSIQAYLQSSACLIAEQNNHLTGVSVFGPLSSNIFELWNIAIDPNCQGKGLGSQLLKQTLVSARKQGASRIELGTGTFGHQLTFYQRAGFRVFEVNQNYFLDNYKDPIIENGIQHQDRLRLAIDLT